MSADDLEALSDRVSEAHRRIQAKRDDINPVISVRRGMRDSGIPADVLTIDCLRTRRRIVLIVHDEEPGVLLHQSADVDNAQPPGEIQRMPLAELDVDTILVWMEHRFTRGAV